MGESRIENILEATINGEPYNEKSQSRVEERLIELKEVIEGGGGGGTSDYTPLSNKPQINSVTLVGNKSWADLGLANPMHIAGRVDTVSELPQTASVGDVYLVGLTAAEKDEYVYTVTGWEYIGASTIPVDSEMSATSENPVQNKVINSALNGKQDTISDLSTIRSNASAGAGAAEVVTGIDSTANNYIELKSGMREYLSTTVPTGNIPTGSLGMGFDEGMWTYRSGTKVSEGEPNLTYGKQFSFYGNGQNLTDYVIYGADSGVGDKTANLFNVETVTNERIIWATGAIQAASNYRISDYIAVDTELEYTCSTQVCFIGYDLNKTYLGVYKNGEWDKTGAATAVANFTNTTELNASYIRILKQTTSVASIMLNEGSTALPYEPYGYKIPVICSGATTTIYLDSPLGANDSIDYTTSQTAIPTVDGLNNLICDTSVQPSKISLTYTGWHSYFDAIIAKIEALENRN